MSGPNNQTKQSESEQRVEKPSSIKMSGTEVAPKTADSTARMEQLYAEFSDAMAGPKSYTKAQQISFETKIFKLVGAVSSEDKERVKLALAYIGVLHGAGPNADYTEINFVPGGSCRKVKMSAIVNDIVGRKYWRKFMYPYRGLAEDLVDCNPDLASKLMERAIRSGVPMTEPKAVIDFGDVGVLSPQLMGYRMLAKQSAVTRANTAGDNVMYSASKHASEDAAVVGQKYTGTTGSGDRYGAY